MLNFSCDYHNISYFGKVLFNYYICLSYLDSFSLNYGTISSVHSICSVMSDSLQPHGLQHTRLPRPSPRFCPLRSARGPCSLGCCSVETAPFSTSPPIRPQVRPRPRGNAQAGLSLSGVRACVHTPAAALPFMGQYQWRPGRPGPGSPRAGAVLGSAFGLCGL